MFYYLIRSKNLGVFVEHKLSTDITLHEWLVANDTLEKEGRHEAYLLARE